MSAWARVMARFGMIAACCLLVSPIIWAMKDATGLRMVVAMYAIAYIWLTSYMFLLNRIDRGGDSR